MTPWVCEFWENNLLFFSHIQEIDILSISCDTVPRQMPQDLIYKSPLFYCVATGHKMNQC